VHGTMAALRRMVPRDSGVVVQVGSALAYRSIPLQAAYCGAKFAVRGFTDSVRTELLHDGSNVHITMVQLPAVNTPQFSWCRTRLPDHPQPVAPIFDPDVPAEAVYWAATHRRRELIVGGSALKAIVASMVAPGLADRYLARTGYDSQQVKGDPVGPDRPDNLFEPVRGVAATRPHALRDYAFIADGERGGLVGPEGDIAWLCFPRWDSDAVFSELIGGGGTYAVRPRGRYVWGGYYER